MGFFSKVKNIFLSSKNDKDDKNTSLKNEKISKEEVLDTKKDKSDLLLPETDSSENYNINVLNQEKNGENQQEDDNLASTKDDTKNIEEIPTQADTSTEDNGKIEKQDQEEKVEEIPAQADTSTEDNGKIEKQNQEEKLEKIPAQADTATEDKSKIEKQKQEEKVVVSSGGFFSKIKNIFTGNKNTVEESKKDVAQDTSNLDEATLTLRLREAEPKLSAWLDIVLEGVEESGDVLNGRISFLLRSLEAPEEEIESFVKDFSDWLDKMEYRAIDEFKSELQYRLALALELEDEEDERSRLFLKLSNGLAKTREQLSIHLDSLFSSHGELDDSFWEEMEELFIRADLGFESAINLVERLKSAAKKNGVTTTEGVRGLFRDEIKSIFAQPKRIAAYTPPEVILMIGVNGAGKTTTIAKLAYRDKMQGKRVMIAAADTFRAAAIDQMRVWANRIGALFYQKQPGSDPAAVAFEAMDKALEEKVDVLYVDTAGRLQTKTNLMDELSKIKMVLGRKHPGAPHKSILVLDATTGQNALSQAKLFKESAGADELILTKLDGTAKGGVAIAVAMQYKIPITYIGLGEKIEDLRPFNGDYYADALISKE